MRTKNAKRPWPVPVTLGVMALAALLAFGLMAANGAQHAAAQDGADCTFNVARGADERTAGTIEDSNGTTVNDSTTGSCFTTNEMATVAIKGPSTAPGSADEDTILHILYEDDDGDLAYYPNGTFYQVNASENPERTSGFYTGRAATDTAVRAKTYSSVTVEVPAAAVVGGKYVAQSVEVMVSGSFRIFDVSSFGNGFGEALQCAPGGSTVGSDITCTDDDDLPSGSENLRADNTADAIVNVTFLGAPSLTQDDIGLGTDTNTTDGTDIGDKDPDGNTDTDPSSKLAAFSTMMPAAHMLVIEEAGSTIDPEDFEDQLWVQAIGTGIDEIPTGAATETANRVFVIAEVRDADGQLLFGGSNIDSAVMFEVMFHADSDLKSVARTGYSDAKEVDSNGRAYIELTGWNTGTDVTKLGPLSVTVTASYTGPSGDLDLGEVKLTRVSAPTELTAGTYMCVGLAEGERAKANDGCPNARIDDSSSADVDETRADTKPVEEMVFGRGETVVVLAELMDMLGSETEQTPTVSLSSDAKTVLVAQIDVAGSLKHYMIKDDADLGTYTDGITVSHGRGDSKLEQKLTFTISGEAENFEFDMPAMYIGLATGTSQMFTIMGADENGNVPSESVMVEVVVLGVESSYVSGLDSDNMLEIKNGSGSFEIFTPVDAEQGDSALILVRTGGSEVVRHAFMFGEEPPENVAPMAEGSIADQTVYVGATVMVDVSGAFSDADMDTLTYTAESDMMDYATASVDGSMVSIMGMAEGMATITVTASDPDGESAMQTIDVTVMEAMLGAPSIDNAMSDAAGMATVMITPGDNADKHYVWAQPTDLSEGMYSDEAAGDAGMVTFSGLTSGMNYWFIAVAGRGEGDDTEWSAWSGWTAATPIQ